MRYTIEDVMACWTGLKVRNLKILSMVMPPGLEDDEHLQCYVEYQSRGKTRHRMAPVAEVLEAAEQHVGLLPRVDVYFDGVLGSTKLPVKATLLSGEFINLSIPYSASEWPAVVRALKLCEEGKTFDETANVQDGVIEDVGEPAEHAS